MKSGAPDPATDLGTFATLADGGVRRLWAVLATGAAAVELIVVRAGDTAAAYVNRCPHFDISLEDRNDRIVVRDRTLVCSHHDATFRFHDGYCTDGPCQGERLTPVAVMVVDGRIRVDDSHAPASVD